MITGSASAGWPMSLRPDEQQEAIAKRLVARMEGFVDTLGVRQNIYTRTMIRLANQAARQSEAIGRVHAVIADSRAVLPVPFLEEALKAVRDWMGVATEMGEILKEADDSLAIEDDRVAKWLAKHGAG